MEKRKERKGKIAGGGAKVQTWCGTEERGGWRGCKARFETIDSSTYREVQQRVQRTRAILAAYSPVCAIRVSTRAATSAAAAAALSVIFFRRSFAKSLDGFLLLWIRLIGRVFSFFSFFFPPFRAKKNRSRIRFRIFRFWISESYYLWIKNMKEEEENIRWKIHLWNDILFNVVDSFAEKKRHNGQGFFFCKLFLFSDWKGRNNCDWIIAIRVI